MTETPPGARIFAIISILFFLLFVQFFRSQNRILFTQVKVSKMDQWSEMNLKTKEENVIKNFSEISTLKVNKTQKYILFWTGRLNHAFWGMGRENITVNNCSFTHKKDFFDSPDKYDALMFHVFEKSWGENPKVRKPEQLYIMTSAEAGIRVSRDLNKDSNFFNLTMTFRRDSDIPSPYGNFYDIAAKKPFSFEANLTWIKPDFGKNYKTNSKVLDIIKKKTKMAAWYVSNCKAPSHRNQLVEKLQQFIDVDIYGKCGNLSCPRNSSLCDEQLTTTYKFYFSFENSLCLDYLTEKVFKVMQQYVIPVVYNGANTSLFLPPHSFIDANSFNTSLDLAKQLKFLANNPEEYAKYFWWKDHYRVQLPSLVNLSKVCQKLNEISLKPVTKVYEDIKSWYTKCFEPTIKF